MLCVAILQYNTSEYFTVFVYFCRHKLEHKKVVSHKGGQREGEIGCKAKLSRVD